MYGLHMAQRSASTHLAGFDLFEPSEFVLPKEDEEISEDHPFFETLKQSKSIWNNLYKANRHSTRLETARVADTKTPLGMKTAAREV